MCGIIGYVGHKQAVPILIDGLKNLEYRGYDSSGVGVISSDQQKIAICKAQGKIVNLQQLLKLKPTPKSTIGISHTRWATHGLPNSKNAHPHNNTSSTISLVHNGIIENYQELKDKLKLSGVKFKSDTDTEVIVHLIEKHYRGNLLEAVQKTIKQLKGAYAIGVIASDEPDVLIAARLGSPLIIGVGKEEHYIASDVPAILDKTRKVVYLKDGQIARMTADDLHVFDVKGKKAKVQIDKISFDIGSAQKEGYAHFMLKEIYEQPKVIQQMVDFRLKESRVVLEGLGLSDKELKEMKYLKIVACGTAYHAGLVGRYIIEQLAQVPVEVDVSSEFRYRSPLINKKTLIIAISQSGETADTLAAVREAKARGAKVISICNVMGSSLARESDGILYTQAGPEIGVASTKAYTAQIAMLYLFAFKLAMVTKATPPKALAKFMRELKRIPKLMEAILKDKAKIAKIARLNSHFGCFLFLGRNINYPTAMEGALKLKEISYIPAEGYPAGEMKHGPIALIDEYRAVVCVTPESKLYEKMISNIQEIISRKGKIIAIATEGDTMIRNHSHHVVYIPKCNPLLSPLLTVLPLQFIAYYVAIKRGCDVDQPRNLAKSVTVE